MKGRDASYKPIQIDGTGLILYTFTKYVNQTRDYDFARKEWKKVKKSVNYIIDNIYPEKGLVFTPNSIHEFPPSEEGLEIWANCACYAALRELSKLAGKLGFGGRRWGEHSKSIRKIIRLIISLKGMEKSSNLENIRNTIQLKLEKKQR